MAARSEGAALRIASAPGRSRVPVDRSEALSSMEAGRQGAAKVAGFPGKAAGFAPKIPGVFERCLS